ncbi:MAG: AMP-binding protein [Spirochaetaceae bacterium]|jgi:long-chain acyl-CoA synthetase|nr:AMP-binding protein [Spirochaetaceae bacterium]
MADKNLIEMLEEAAVKFQGRPYLCDKSDSGWESICFEQALDLTEKLASGLLNRGIGKEDKAVILSEGRSSWVLSEIALFRVGAISVPLSLKLMIQEIPFRVNHSEAKVIFFSHITWEKIKEIKDQLQGNILYICLDSSPELLNKIASEGALNRGKNLITWQELLEEGRSSLSQNRIELEQRCRAIALDDVVNVCYTSGTTGNPKGIMLTHRNYYSNIMGAVGTVYIPENWRTLVILPIDHSFAHTVALYIALERAISLYFVDARDGASSILRNIPINLKEVNPHFLLTVPALTGNFMKKMKAGVEAKGGLIASIFRKGLVGGMAIHGDGYHKGGLWKRLRYGFIYGLAKMLIFPKLRQAFGSSIKFCIGGGALLDVKQQQFFNTIGVPVYQGYGLTEASPIISANGPGRYKFGTSGSLLPNLELKIMKDQDTAASPGEKGEIVIRGGNVMKGYLKNPQATDKALVDGWLFTGDLGYMDEDDFLMVVGREKALLISGDGEKYSPEEIEEAITNCSDLIDQCMLWCDHRLYTSALLVLDQQKAKLLKDLSPEEQLQKVEEQLNLFRKDPSFKDKFPSKWLPGTFLILAEPFTEQNQMINSTMKMVRFKISQVYQQSIDYMYSDEGKKSDNPKNRQALEGLFK